MSLFRLEMIVLVLALPAAGCTPEPLEEVTVWEGEDFFMEIVELSTADRDALLAAPRSAMNHAPPKELSEAIRIGSVGSIKVQLIRDKVDGKIVDEMPPTYQGWIYYTPIALAEGTPHTPAVLCVSQSEEIQWFHCQDESAFVTQRLAKKRLRETDT